jgi:transposase
MEEERMKLLGTPSTVKTESDPEVRENKPRRKFTAKYKLDILRKADACTELGQIGALLRREGLFSSNLTTWRRQREQGLLDAMSPKKRGPKKQEINPLSPEVARLQKDNERLKRELKQAQTIIEVQKKVSEILGIPQDHDEGSSS